MAKIEILNAITTHFKIKVGKELAPRVLYCKVWLALNECKKLGHQRNFKMLDECVQEIICVLEIAADLLGRHQVVQEG